MDPIKAGISKNQSAINEASGFWSSIGEALANVEWEDVAHDLYTYQQQYAEPHLNDYASWKTGVIHQHVPNELDGWDYEDKYKGKRPDSRLLYIDAAGTASQPRRYGNRIAGHVALEIDGTVYNYTPNGMQTVKARNYIHNVTHRQKEAVAQTVWAYPLGLTSNEKKAAIRELETYYGKAYDLEKQQCALCTINVLKNTTKNTPLPVKKTIPWLDPLAQIISGINPYSPTDVLIDAKESKRIYGPTFIYQPPNQLRTWDNSYRGIY